MFLFQLIVGIAVQSLEVAGTKSTISPSYLWPLRFIYNKKVPVVPPLDIHGDVINDAVGLRFDGKTAWLDAGELTGSCVAQPQKCTNGLSVVMRIKISSSNTTNATYARFLFDSGGYNGEGVSLYMRGEEIICEVADKTKFWRASSKLQLDNWHLVLVTWSSQEGIMLFIDGPMIAQNTQPKNFRLNPVATSNHVIIGRCNAEMGKTFAMFSSDLVAVFDSVTPDGKIYLSYSFSAPSTRGNIRYVNAKFINTADFDLIIFPDRGEHQKAGYQLEAHSSTLLEYVLREGPLPVGMNFRLQNKKNGEQLILNGKYDFHVISSDDKQVVKEYRILPDSRITALTSTSAVSINYNIRPATITVEQQPPSSTGNTTSSPSKESQAIEEQNALIDNPEIPLDNEGGDNTTQQLQPEKTGTGSEGNGQQIEKPGKKPEVALTETTRNGTNTTEGSTLPQVTSTIAPTLPPPPQYTTKAPNTTQSVTSKGNGSTKPGENEENTTTSPELPDDEQKVPLQEVESNMTNANSTDDNGLLGEVEEPKNGTITTQGNVTGSNATNNKTVTDTIKEEKKLPEQKIATNTRPADEKTAPIAHIDTPNPWLNTAKEVQNQKPIKWQDGQGLHNAINDMRHAMDNNIQGYENELATINYNKGKATGQAEKPVWKYLNGEPEINQLFGQDKFRNVERLPGSTSPFKFANTKTQKEITSYYRKNKNNNEKNNEVKAKV